jgi:hypothetical protein
MKIIHIRLNAVEAAALEEMKKASKKFRDPERLLIEMIMAEYTQKNSSQCGTV